MLRGLVRPWCGSWLPGQWGAVVWHACLLCQAQGHLDCHLEAGGNPVLAEVLLAEEDVCHDSFLFLLYDTT